MARSDDDTPYLLRGQQSVATTSSQLVSSSKYLNDPRLRDWVSTHYLRRSGSDLPSPSDPMKLHMILMELQDLDRIEALFTAERQRWPDLDRWFEEGFVSSYTRDALLAYPAGSVGATFGDYVVRNNFDLDLIARFEPKTQYDYYRIRSAQTHDLEHIVCGGGFDVLGELIPYYMRLANVPRFLSAELAGEVNLIHLFGSTRILMRTGLHYPQSYPAALETIQRGMAVGQLSGPLFMARYEDVLHLPIAEARTALGVVGAVDVDTGGASAAWDEYR